MKSSLDRAQAIEKLRVQRHRLEGALARFYSHDLPGNDVSFEAAALDVAMPIRVMVHHVPDRKPPSICLLHQIDPGYWKKPIHFEPAIAPRPRMVRPGLHQVTIVLPWKINIGPGETPSSPPTYKFTRYKEGPYSQTRVPLKNWWTDACWDSGSNRVSNKDLVLAMTNKEGGAHVDADMPAKYRVAKAQGAIGIGAMGPVSDIAKLGSLIAFAAGELLEYLDQNFGDCFPVTAAAAAPAI